VVPGCPVQRSRKWIQPEEVLRERGDALGWEVMRGVPVVRREGERGGVPRQDRRVQNGIARIGGDERASITDERPGRDDRKRQIDDGCEGD
jgi:hypothetical protein